MNLSLGKLESLWEKFIKEKIPLQYLVGQCPWRDFIIEVNSEVLIPRPETERLVDISLECINKLSHPRILEVGTGSGCISISIALMRGDAKILSIDISQNALNKAQENSDYHKTNNVKFLNLDFLKEIPSERFDIIVSNPPYIPLEEMKNIMIDVKEYEPEIALTDYIDGLRFYERFAELGPKILKKEGWMVLEVGTNNHPEKVAKVFHSKGYNNIELVSDYNNDKRVLKVKI